MTHPGLDLTSDRVAVVVQNRPVVSCSTWLADAIRVCAGSGRGLQVLTPARSRLTLPLRLALVGPGTRWVVRDPGGGHYDGLSGAVLHWDGEMFAPPRDDAEGAPRSPVYTAPGEPPVTLLMVNATVHHPPDDDIVLGGAAEVLCASLTGAGPAGWGVSEPAGTPWRTETITALCRNRAPLPTWLTFVGRTVIGTIRVDRVGSGIEETVTLLTAAPPDDLPGVAARVAGRFTLVSLLAQSVPGRADLTTEPRWTGLPAPLGLAVGTEAPEVPGGRPAEPLWHDLGNGHDLRAWERFGRLMRRFAGTGPLSEGT
ncbi:hypothetical protein DPM19_26725 [Actinomadura craniellae]|uniref:Uncharacterized protein n=1 Tax=Actinomadura craniellae TaxID=2231787 RepID=A0A365GYR1_9ACTN|nr:DUF6177 family protein [Actinomadura craniellae]RAY11952.1 hypothetical protein DPM19_26725 [Actinomadura craniellae]